MKVIYVILALCFTLDLLAQESITFKVEDLSKPNKILPEKETDEILKKLINNRVDSDQYIWF